LLKLIGTLLVGILSAALATIYHDDIAAFLGRAPVTAEITVGPWFPHFDASKPDDIFDDRDEKSIRLYTDDDDLNFARIVIKNTSGKEIENAFVRINEPDWADFDALIITEDEKKIYRTGVPEVESKIALGKIPPADKLIVYLWSNAGFGYPYADDSFSIVTSDGSVPTTKKTFISEEQSSIFGISSETIAWIFVFGLLIIGGILVYSASHAFSFAKSLLKDDDYFLDQKERFEREPNKFSVPDSLPK